MTDLSKYDIDIETPANHHSTNIRLSFLLLHSIGNELLHKLFVVIDIWAILNREWSVVTVKIKPADPEVSPVVLQRPIRGCCIPPDPSSARFPHSNSKNQATSNESSTNYRLFPPIGASRSWPPNHSISIMTQSPPEPWFISAAVDCIDKSIVHDGVRGKSQ